AWAPNIDKPKNGFDVTVHSTSMEEARGWFDRLSAGGRVGTPFDETFWSPGYGSVIDQFGIPWMVNVMPGPDWMPAPASQYRGPLFHAKLFLQARQLLSELRDLQFQPRESVAFASRGHGFRRLGRLRAGVLHRPEEQVGVPAVPPPGLALEPGHERPIRTAHQVLERGFNPGSVTALAHAADTRPQFGRCLRSTQQQLADDGGFQRRELQRSEFRVAEQVLILRHAASVAG